MLNSNVIFKSMNGADNAALDRIFSGIKGLRSDDQWECLLISMVSTSLRLHMAF